MRPASTMLRKYASAALPEISAITGLLRGAPRKSHAESPTSII
jgi:hypothetical protein